MSLMLGAARRSHGANTRAAKQASIALAARAGGQAVRHERIVESWACILRYLKILVPGFDVDFY